jgi:hypothetical protein
MPYRDDVESLRTREAALERELDETRRARMACEKRSLPVLESVRVASPCPERWEDMIGDDRMRFCARCAKNVYDLSSMSREVADQFLREQREPVCVTFLRRRDGKIMTSDCAPGARRRTIGAGIVALVCGGAAAAMALPGGVEAPLPGVPAPQPRAESAPAPHHAKRTTGCVCTPHDPLCSCLPDEVEEPIRRNLGAPQAISSSSSAK